MLSIDAAISKNLSGWAAAGVSVAAFLEWAPKVAAVLSSIWLLILISEWCYKKLGVWRKRLRSPRPPQSLE